MTAEIRRLGKRIDQMVKELSIWIEDEQYMRELVEEFRANIENAIMYGDATIKPTKFIGFASRYGTKPVNHAKPKQGWREFNRMDA